MARDENEGFIVRAFELHAAAEKGAGEALLSAFSNVAVATKTYTFKHRLKSPAAIEGKVHRKRAAGAKALAELDQVDTSSRNDAWVRQQTKAEEDASYTPDHVTDVLGCRFVTLYQSEIPQIVDGLLDAIELYNQDCRNRPVDASEFVIYTNRPTSDPLSIVNDVQQSVERSFLFKDVPADIREPETRKSAYSSVHLVFVHDVSIRHPGKEEGEERVAFEVQIRDIFEEGWGEVQHDLLYSEKDRPSEDEAPGERVNWTLHLNALKTFVDGCSQHASIIKANLESIRASKAPTTANESVSERRSDLALIIPLLRRFRATKELQRNVGDGYALLMSAEDAADEDQCLRRLRGAASSLDAAIRSLTPRQREAPMRGSGLPVGYYLEMEAAAARVAAALLVEPGAAEHLRGEAETIYESLETRHPNNPTIKMRLGKVVQSGAQSASDLERAERLFDETIALVGGDPATGDDHWIAISARIDKGYSIWRRGKLQSSSDALRQHLVAAASATRSALDIWRGQSPTGNELNRVIGHKAAANLVYYLANIVEQGGELSHEQRQELETTVQQVERYAGEPYADWFKTRDSLIHAYRALGRQADLLAHARSNFVELRRIAEEKAGRPLDFAEVETYLSGSAASCFATARAEFMPHPGGHRRATM